MAKLRLNINGIEVTGYDGQTILEVAKENGIEIPTLCYDERVAVYGACGLCVVEMEGSPKLLRACATTISEGMVIKTDTPKVIASRKAALELLLSDHNGDCRPPCALACPAQTDCQGYVGMVANGQYKEAVKLVKDRFPFPASIGRVCPHPCETACRRQLVEEPISIAHIKSFIGDKDLESGDPYMPEVGAPTGHTIAVVGGGPAGLTAAYQLRRKGHEVAVYDAMPKMGGMLRYGIPQYRLPKEILDEEIGLIEGMGVEMRPSRKIGRDVSFSYLRKKYDAVVVSVGAWKSIQMGIPGEDNANVYGGIDFLRKVAMDEDIFIGQNVAVVGGGNTAMDACRTAVRLGAKNVYCIYRRTRDEMPAEDIEIEEAQEEGVIFKYLSNPTEIVSAPDGRIECVKVQKMELGEPDASGRRRPIPVEGAIEDVKISCLIMALGQRLDIDGFEDLERTKKGTIAADETTYRTNLDNVFACGEATNKGPGIAVASIGDAIKAADVIDSYLKGNPTPYKKPYVVERTDITEETFADRERIARAKMSHLSAEARRDNFHEVNDGYTEEQAKCEASRCLECGCHDYYECKLIAYANSYDVHPEKYDGDTHARTIDNTHPFIDRNPDKCILCGLCVRVCDEVMGRTALGLVGRGFDTIVKPALDMPLRETDCISCGQCINLCPTGALGEKDVYRKRVPAETTCTTTACAFCSVGCKTTIQTAGSVMVKSTPDEEHKGTLCVNGRFGYGKQVEADRIKRPMVRKNGELCEVAWEEAFLYVAKKLQSVASRYGKDAVAAAVSDKFTSEDIYMAKKYADCIMKSPYLFSYSRISGGASQVLGMDGSTCKIEELLSTDLIVLVSTNLMEEHASLGVKVRQAKMRGAKTIVISDLPDSQEAEEADLYLQAEDMSVLKGILKALIDAGRTAEGVELLKESVKDCPVTEEFRQAADMLISAKKAIIVAEQSWLTAEASKAAADIAVLSGHIGSPRNGFLQIKANANSQGLCDMGIASYEDVAEVIDSEKIQAMFIIGEDIPGFDRSGKEFVAVQDIYLTETAKQADAVLPAISLVESAGHVTSCDGTVSEVKSAIPALSLPNWKVLQGISNAMKQHYDFADETDIARQMQERHAVKAGVLNPVLQPVADGAMYQRRANTSVAVNRFKELLKSEGLA